MQYPKSALFHQIFNNFILSAMLHQFFNDIFCRFSEVIFLKSFNSVLLMFRILWFAPLPSSSLNLLGWSSFFIIVAFPMYLFLKRLTLVISNTHISKYRRKVAHCNKRLKDLEFSSEVSRMHREAISSAKMLTDRQQLQPKFIKRFYAQLS